MTRPLLNSRGTVSLVALCFVAVLGIVLASYLAVCSRAMNLSNRSFQNSLSNQLAEFGLEEGLRAFNKNDWSGWTNGITVSWDTTTYAANKRAVGTVTFPAGKFGQGTTSSVKIRIDNFDSAVLGTPWVSSAASYPSYRVGDLVGHNGTWYRCIKAHSTLQTPNVTGNLSYAYWVPAPVPWAWRPSSSYKDQEVVHNGVRWYRSTSDHNSPATWTGTNWSSIGEIDSHANSQFSHSIGDIFYFGNSTTWYRWTGTGSTAYTSSPEISWQYQSGKNYSFNDLVCYWNAGSYIWYRCKAPTSQNNLPTSSSWENALNGMWAWNSNAINYSLGDSVYYNSNSRWYRCIKAHTSSGSYAPTNTTYWAATPLYSTIWQQGRHYAKNDLVRYNGHWYRCLEPTNVNLPTDTSFWAGPTDSLFAWNPTTAYAAGSLIRYSGAWYTCVTANTGQSPNDTTYWTSTRGNSAGISTGAPVVYAEAIVSISGSPPIRTQMRALISPVSLFPNAAGATTALSLNTGTVDSYNSNLGDYGGSNVSSSAVLASESSLTIAGTLALKGYLNWPSPPAGVNGAATINGTLYSDNKSRVSRSPNIPIFSIQDVPGGSQLSTTTNVTLGTAGSTVPSVYYYENSFGSTSMTLNSSSEIITVIGPTILYVAGNLRLYQTNGARIRITPTGSLRLVVGGNFQLQETSGIENQTKDPAKCTILCKKSGPATLEFSAAAYPFYGTIYIPNSTSTFTIGNGVEIFGAVSAQNLTFDGTAKLHYDTALLNKPTDGVDQPYTATELRELPQTEWATMP